MKPVELTAWDERLLASSGITGAEYRRLLEAQGGGCAICGKTENVGGRRLHVDHDHASEAGGGFGTVRGLLCFSCNVLVGGVERYGEEVREYLADPPAPRIGICAQAAPRLRGAPPEAAEALRARLV